ncbi:MAG: T9SS type A sorting domain-containing protein [Bacteroidota bacterium]
MKKNSTLSILLATILGILSTSAQEETDKKNYLFDDIGVYLYSPNQERKKSKEYFVALKELAEAQNDTALYYLGLFQKAGIGTNQSFKKSLKSFKKAFELGNQEAAYCVGYYYLKGFGDVQQDYTKAYRWFKKSDVPMARHWMAKMQFLGLGREANKTKAVKMLKTNDIYNSMVLLKQYENRQSPSWQSEMFSELIGESSINELHGLSSLHDVPGIQFLYGTWQGEYIELDWSKQKVMRALPLNLSLIGKEGINGSLETTIKIADSISNASGTYSAGGLRFSNLEIPIKKQYTDYPNFTHLMTEINGFELRICPYNGENLLIGRVDAYHPVWKERANPILVILRKKIDISEEAIAAFNEQASDLIRIYPNPFSEHCLINFELPNDANVKVEISNYYNTPSYHRTVLDGKKEIGTHILEIQELPSTPGSYVITISYDGKKENKIIIKK